ncbi:Asp-tRNA(Asn)/Glu-tRNA(Gln) amidotransferase subunit GatC [Nocardioides donggukensis]|uniref:Aspartyl/glutamyl-tRNA(Asn/Gln) amidotransferase subunit C n=1 Tax=Nocardioides donggukensis TaxID=2774019 RepID=A0A927PZD8_9ACTN|nr:Asp-tRNA(Asn)/Glu-tRNA(Gln) amidotransferase subunit GatC [Nocardioides donggukensis]MBD8868950.1 Asp-tRNA(Asn)/Glu-tRNA(Gln) amidotransferase subunit GatC [Nocardioides donggukensis]
MADAPGPDGTSAARVEITRDEVAHLADLARIDLSDAELDHLAPQLSVILESVASITGVAGEDVPPTSHALPMSNVMREDVVVPGLSAEQALSGAPASEQQRFSVPRILGDEQ